MTDVANRTGTFSIFSRSSISVLPRIASVFPPINMRSRSDKALKTLGIEPARYLTMAIVLSVLFALAFTLVLGLWLPVGQRASEAAGAPVPMPVPAPTPAHAPVPSMQLPIVLLPAVFVATIVLSFCFFLAIPKMAIQKRTRELEVELPFFLRSVGMLLEINVGFRRAIEVAMEGKGALREEMQLVLKHMDEGISFQKSISTMASSFDSMTVKRAISQMILAYETGASGSEMKRVGDELLAVEQHRLKEYSARSAMFGLLFIISSAILPTFFLIYAVVSTKNQLSAGQMTVAMLILFPAISTLILLISKATMPQDAFSKRFYFDIKLLAPAAIFLIGFLAFPEPQKTKLAQLAFMILGSTIGAYFIYANYKKEHKIDEIEAYLPDALFAVSGMPKATKLEVVLRAIEEGGFGALSEETGISRKQLQMNIGAGAVLDDLAGRNQSEMLRRTCVVVKEMMETNSLDRLGFLAEDMVRNAQIKRERSQLFALQKYTLIFGAAIIPAILKMALNLLQNVITIMDGGVGTSTGIISTAFSLVAPYLVIYAIMASLAIADAEGKRSSMPVYCIGLAGIGIAVFNLVQF